MNFWQAVASGFSNYVKFSGRAIRSEYWYWVLFDLIVTLAAILLDVSIVKHRHGPLESAWQLVTFLPGLALAFRRLHDVDRSGWWLALPLGVVGVLAAIGLLFTVRSISLPLMIILGAICIFVTICIFVVLICWLCRPGTPGPNRYGADPFAPDEHINRRLAI
jgi:uncharacterized membrane protein YhaH (DUF805 family)